MKRTLVAITLDELNGCVAISEVKSCTQENINELKNKVQLYKQEQAKKERLLVERIDTLEETIRSLEQEIKVLKGEEE